MKIEKFKKDKKNLYKVIFEDGTEVLLYDDVIVKYNLLVNKEMDNKLFEEIINYNSFLDGYYKAIKYINTKLRTELEIRKYLKKLCIKESNIDELIVLLYKDGYLNKEKYLIAYVNDQYNLTINGPLKIKKNLIDLGYSDKEIDYLYNFDWNSRIDGIINKKIKINHKLSNNNLKTKIINDIMKLGYEREEIINRINLFELKSDEDILIRELIKVKNRLCKKYESNELEYKVINYLYKKGFDLEEIKRCYDENNV